MTSISRERAFAIIAGAVGLVILGFFVQRWVSGQYSTRTRDKTTLETDLGKLKRQVNVASAASRKVAAYEARSLPANPEIARTRYQTWLANEMEGAGLIEPDIHLQGARPEKVDKKDFLTRQTFTIVANGTLPQVVEFLHAFYSVDWLHRITHLSLRPLKDSKLLDVKITVEALSLRRAKSVDKLEEIPSQRLALASRDAYYDSIVGRNLFGPRNNEPKIEVNGPRDVFVTRDVELNVTATDPDPLDYIYVQLVESASPEAKIDPMTGKFTWKPTEPGKYEFVFEGIDDGFPTRASNREKIVINVKEQPKPPEKTGLEFDVAKFTVLTAILDIDGQGEIWLNVRPMGQIVVLHEGDQFEVGSVKGTVSEIGEYDFSFDFEGKRRKLSKGELLDQAKVISETPATAPVSSSASSPQDKAS